MWKSNDKIYSFCCQMDVMIPKVVKLHNFGRYGNMLREILQYILVARFKSRE